MSASSLFLMSSIFQKIGDKNINMVEAKVITCATSLNRRAAGAIANIKPRPQSEMTTVNANIKRKVFRLKVHVEIETIDKTPADSRES